jgi:hypothetical protein
VAPAAGAPSKAKKAAEKKVVSGDDEAAKDQQEADEVDALADEPAENGAAALIQGALLFLSHFSPLREYPRVLMSMLGLQRLGQTKPQAVSSLKVPKSKSPLQPRRPKAPFILGPCP